MKKILICISLVFSFQVWADDSETFTDDDIAEIRKLDAVEAEKDPEHNWVKSAKPTQYMRQDCPVIANTETNMYHLPGQPNYRMMLMVNKCVTKAKCKDNRRCFENEVEAQAEGFKKSKAGGKKT